MPRNCTVFLLPRRLARSAIYGSQIFDSQKWPNMLVRKVKGKPRNLEANVCGSLYSTFKTSFQSYAFYDKLLQTLFKDQLDRSKATCSFNLEQRLMGKPLFHQVCDCVVLSSDVLPILRCMRAWIANFLGRGMGRGRYISS